MDHSKGKWGIIVEQLSILMEQRTTVVEQGSTGVVQLIPIMGTMGHCGGIVKYLDEIEDGYDGTLESCDCTVGHCDGTRATLVEQETMGWYTSVMGQWSIMVEHSDETGGYFDERVEH